MLKKIVVSFFLFLSLAVFSQNIVKGNLIPAENYPIMVLYKMEGSQQKYIAYDSIKNGRFIISIPQQAKKGMYRLFYDLQRKLYVDFVYDKENVEVKFSPRNPLETAQFLQSDSNILYQNYLRDIAVLQSAVNQLQLDYFSANTDADKEKITRQYKKARQAVDEKQTEYENNTKNTLVHKFIKLKRMYNGENPAKDPTEYLETIKSHFFDFTDFSDQDLISSTLIHQKINDFIFKTADAEDSKTREQLIKNGIDVVLEKLNANPALSKDIQETLLYNFALAEKINLVNYVLNSYLKMPRELQDREFIKEIKGQLKTAVGNIAPNIQWYNKEQKSLHKLSGSPYYLVVFWSSTCGHCLKELPELKEFLKNRNDIEVIALGLETNESKPTWDEKIVDYPKWHHVYGENKWKNKYVTEYGIRSTPSLFLLDSKKKIIAKPEHLNDLVEFFNKK